MLSLLPTSEAEQPKESVRDKQLLNDPNTIVMDISHKLYPLSYVPTGNEPNIPGRVVKPQAAQQLHAAKSNDSKNKPKFIHMDVSHKLYPSSYVPTGDEPIVYGRVVDPPNTQQQQSHANKPDDTKAKPKPIVYDVGHMLYPLSHVMKGDEHLLHKSRRVQ